MSFLLNRDLRNSAGRFRLNSLVFLKNKATFKLSLLSITIYDFLIS